MKNLVEWKKSGIFASEIITKKFNIKQNNIMEKIYLVNTNKVISSCRTFDDWTDTDVLKLAETHNSHIIRVFGNLKAFCFCFNANNIPNCKNWYMRVIDTKTVKVNWDSDSDYAEDEDGEIIPTPAKVIDIPKSVKDDDVADYLSDNYGYCVNSWELVAD